MREAPVPAWSIVLRLALGLLWAAHGLEKFGVDWPKLIAGGTGSVAGMLELMAGDTPFRVLKWSIERVMLPAAGWLQVPVGVIELGLALAFLSGRGLFVATLLGGLTQTFFWLGFFTTDWPLQYPTIIAMHGCLGLFQLDRLSLSRRVRWGRASERLAEVGPDRWLWVLRMILGALWLYEFQRAGWPAAAIGGLLVLGAFGRLALLCGLALIALAWPAAWGSWPWSYYMVAAAHIAAWTADSGRIAGLDAWLGTVLPRQVGRWLA